MNFFYVIQEAVQSLRSNVLRSALTVIGIIVGIFSVTAMLALGAGLSNNILDRFNQFITGDITVSGDLSHLDMEWIAEQPYVEAVLGTQSVSGADVVASGSGFNPTVSVMVGDYESLRSPVLVSGTLFDFNNWDYSEQVAVVDQGFIDKVKQDTGTDLSSGIVAINGQRFNIVAVIEGGSAGFGRRSDGTVIIPYATALGVVTNTKQFSSIGVDLVDQQYYEIAGRHILEALNMSRYADRDSEEYFSVSSAQDAIDSANETTQMISLFLGIVGGIALFVGGIGTMNMMLTTVTERTKEIGLRKAIGARNRDILLQILVESVMLTVIGGAIGIGLTYGASYVANQALADTNVISILMSNTVVFYAALVSFVVGVVFGVYPAINASKLQPVDALRTD